MKGKVERCPAYTQESALEEVLHASLFFGTVADRSDYIFFLFSPTLKHVLVAGEHLKWVLVVSLEGR